MEKQPTVFAIACKCCGKLVANSKNVLGRHIRSVHKLEYPDYIVMTEHNGEHPRCVCGQKLTWHKGGFGRFCSKSCSSKGENNPMFGKKGGDSPIKGIKRTPEQIVNYKLGSIKRWEKHGDMLREMMNAPEYKDAQSSSQQASYRDNPDRSQNMRRNLHKFWNENPMADQRRKEARDRALILLEQGRIGPQAPYKTEWKFNPFTSQKEYMHSSYETEFLDLCIKNGTRATKSHSLSIDYVDSEGVDRTYRPDFLLTESNTIVETKGRIDEDVYHKFIAAVRWASQNEFSYVFLVHSDEEFVELNLDDLKKILGKVRRS